MRRLKRTVAAILTVAVLSAMLFVPAEASGYKDVNDGEYYAEAIDALTLYGVVSGFAGYFDPNAYVTRAQFSKMIAIVAGLDDEVYSSAGNKKFDDVSVEYWGTGYINTVANNKLLVGYPNGYFMPEKNITFAEAVTVLLRAMNYTTAELGDNWPYSYMVKAASLGLTDGVQLENDSFITRADLCVIINRALQKELNGSTEKLISKMDISITDELLIIATKNEDASLDANQIKTSAGNYKLANQNLKLIPLTKVKLVLNEDKEVINFDTTYVPKQVITTVESFVDGTVYFANGTTSKSIGVADSTPVYSDGAITSYGAFKSGIEDGAAVSVLYDENGSVGYLLFNDVKYTDAVTVRDNIYTALNSVGVTDEKINSASVIRNGYAATLDDVELYDVAYYLADNSTIYLYSDKLSGVYNKAYPSKANVTSIDLSGNRLELETQTAAYKLGEKPGSYKLNSKITALLGRDGKIADVVDLNASSAANYCILLSTESSMSSDILESGKQYKYINVMNGEGKTVSYRTLKGYSDKIGYIGKLDFDSDGNATFSGLAVNASVTGRVDKNNKKIGEHWLTSDAVILERVYAPETGVGTAKAQVIDIEDINVSELTSKQVLYAVTSGEFGDVSLLIVENVTKNQYTYGLLTGFSGKASGMNAMGSYEVFSDGATQTYTTNFYTKIAVGSGVAMVIDGGQLVSLKALTKVGSTAKCEAIDFTRVRVGKETFELGNDVQIMKKNSTKGYTNISMEDAAKLTGATVNLYADASVSSGGLVRLVVFN